MKIEMLPSKMLRVLEGHRNHIFEFNPTQKDQMLKKILQVEEEEDGTFPILEVSVPYNFYCKRLNTSTITVFSVKTQQEYFSLQLDMYLGYCNFAFLGKDNSGTPVMYSLRS